MSLLSVCRYIRLFRSFLFVLFDLRSALLRFYLLCFLIFHCGWATPAAVPGFRFPSLVFPYFLRIHQRPAMTVEFPFFLSGFFLVSIPLRASRLPFTSRFSDSPSFWFAGLSVITCGSPDVSFILVLFSCTAILHIQLFLISWATPSRVMESVFACHFSAFLLRTSVSYRGCFFHFSS